MENVTIKSECLVGTSNTVADPGFPRGWFANYKGEGANILFWSIFPKNA